MLQGSVGELLLNVLCMGPSPQGAPNPSTKSRASNVTSVEVEEHWPKEGFLWDHLRSGEMSLAVGGHTALFFGSHVVAEAGSLCSRCV